jgi:hypothetical protein
MILTSYVDKSGVFRQARSEDVLQPDNPSNPLLDDIEKPTTREEQELNSSETRCNQE